MKNFIVRGINLAGKPTRLRVVAAESEYEAWKKAKELTGCCHNQVFDMVIDMD